MGADRVLGALVLLKGLDVALRGPQALAGPLRAAVLLGWLAAGGALLVGRLPSRWVRSAWGAVLLAGTALAVDYPLDLRRQHLFLLLGTALAAVVARDRAERLLLWRVQLTALYGVAALAKCNESFLGGDVLAVTLATGPLGAVVPAPPVLLLVSGGALLVAAEATLAAAPWLPGLRPAAVSLAAALHLAALVLASTSPSVGLRLVVFGGTAVVLCAASAGLLSADPAR